MSDVLRPWKLRDLTDEEADWVRESERRLAEYRERLSDLSDDEFVSVGRVRIGLLDGDLAPLAEHIRSGFSIDGVIARQLLSAIEANDIDQGYRLQLKGRKSNQRPFSQLFTIHLQKLRIGRFIARRKERAGQGQHEAILADAANHFGISQKSAEAAFTYLGKALRYEAGEFAKVDFWGAMAEVEERWPNE